MSHPEILRYAQDDIFKRLSLPNITMFFVSKESKRISGHSPAYLRWTKIPGI